MEAHISDIAVSNSLEVVPNHKDETLVSPTTPLLEFPVNDQPIPTPSQSPPTTPVMNIITTPPTRTTSILIADREGQVSRSRSLTRPERARYRSRHDFLSFGGITPTETSFPAATDAIHQKDVGVKKERDRTYGCWPCFVSCATCYAPSCLLDKCGMHNEAVRYAWREKMGLVTIIVFMCMLVGFITFGFEQVVCGIWESRIQRFPYALVNTSLVNIRGELYDLSKWQHPGTKVPIDSIGGKDVSWLFPQTNSVCDGIPDAKPFSVQCTVENKPGGFCHSPAQLAAFKTQAKFVGEQSFDWSDIENVKNPRFMVFNGWVLNMDRYLKESNDFLNIADEVRDNLRSDSTLTFVATKELKRKMQCLLEKFKVGYLERQSIGCFASQVFMWASLLVILTLILVRFFIALYFNWFVAGRLGRIPRDPNELAPTPAATSKNTTTPTTNDSTLITTKSSPMAQPETIQLSKLAPGVARAAQRSSFLPSHSRFSLQYNNQLRYSSTPSHLRPKHVQSTLPTNVEDVEPDALATIPVTEHTLQYILRTIILVTCYSESESGLRTTLDSIALTTFPESHKLLFVIADGIITGSGNAKSTPQTLIDMMDLDPRFSNDPEAYSYVAIADGAKRHNMAKVYAGWYRVEDRKCPMILVVKCGTPEEAHAAKPGNRGKRDSQIILMQFLSKILFNERLTPLEYDLFTKLMAVSGKPERYLSRIEDKKEKVTADMYELVLMVDADTKVEPDCLTVMSAAMASDPRIMGLCGETRIVNKAASFTTSIQVFEYFISHFLAKSFESVFGSVTCLPGCFCMYRIKAPKGYDAEGTQYHVPILANPDIVEQYSENVVDTLHKKNLLLLGEDRYLTTLMLRKFPKRKLMFVPNAVCRTLVPDEFKVLLSQRRRWINSTIHNLMELVLVRDMCGIFCFSMQFAIFMELVGTVVLPAAITFTVFLIFISFFVDPVPIIPLALLGAILGLPAVLIFLTSPPNRWSYIGWMVVYLFALPIWNFVLPVYAFWHFDDFSWGETRKVQGETGGGGHGDKEGEFDESKIIMKSWVEWETERRVKQNQNASSRLRESTYVYEEESGYEYDGGREDALRVLQGR